MKQKLHIMLTLPLLVEDNANVFPRLVWSLYPSPDGRSCETPAELESLVRLLKVLVKFYRANITEMVLTS